MKKNALSIAISLALLGGSSVVTADTTDVDVMSQTQVEIMSNVVAFNQVAIEDFQNKDDDANDADNDADDANDADNDADDADDADNDADADDADNDADADDADNDADDAKDD